MGELGVVFFLMQTSELNSLSFVLQLIFTLSFLIILVSSYIRSFNAVYYNTNWNMNYIITDFMTQFTVIT